MSSEDRLLERAREFEEREFSPGMVLEAGLEEVEDFLDYEHNYGLVYDPQGMPIERNLLQRIAQYNLPAGQIGQEIRCDPHELAVRPDLYPANDHLERIMHQIREREQCVHTEWRPVGVAGQSQTENRECDICHQQLGRYLLQCTQRRMRA